MEENLIPPPLSPSATSSGSSPTETCSSDFDMMDQGSWITNDVPLFDRSIDSFAAMEEEARHPSTPRANIVVIDYYQDFQLFENEDDDMCLGEEDFAVNRRALSIGYPEGGSDPQHSRSQRIRAEHKAQT
ncbi:hypothetical protein INT43_004990 [Umbelopsis isabellina]|uniref:Uncharacterized protein n=1 Tax=Mortierella isabellina TaxID=91625 RepID=A0A8H7UA57_MORIS|nr:hypothetical protein INT43_004990 [Umbelopsis isabellina]